MPSAINIDGKVTRRPGVFGKADVSALAGSVLDVNRVALMGEFPLIEHAVPMRLNTPQSFKDLDTQDIDGLAIFAKYLWNAADDPKVPGGPNAVFLLNVQTNTQAQFTFQDATLADSLVLKSQMWGPRGNKTRVTRIENTDDPLNTLFDFVIDREGVSETYTALGSGDLASFWHDGTQMDDVTMAFTGGTLTITQTKAAIALGIFTPAEAAFDGLLTITPSVVPDAGPDNEFRAVIVGINKATGLADGETIIWPASDGAAKPSVKAYSAVTTITFEEDLSQTPSFTLTNPAFALEAADYPKVSDLQARVDSFNAQEFYATNDLPKAFGTNTADVDDFASATIYTPALKKALRADLAAIILALNASILVTPSKASGAVGPPDAPTPPAAASVTFLTGGTKTATDATSRAAALVALRQEDVQILVTDLSDSVFHDEIDTHCAQIVNNGGGERNAWMPAACLETKAQIATRTAALNSRHSAMVAQDVQAADTAGAVTWYDPWLLAIMMAGMQASTQVGTPLTWKRANLVDVRQNTGWNPNNDAEELLEKGLCFLSRYRLGWRVERSITTYQIDDNPIFSEVSANESMDTSIRDLRENLEAFIGDPNVITTRARVESVAKNRLREQVELGIIKAFNEPALVATDLGDRFRVDYELAATEPINFIQVTATVTRTPFGK